MTDQEFNEEQAKLLRDIPEEFHAALTSMAYEKGHAYGHREILLYLEDYVDALREPIKKYTERLKQTPS